MLGCVRPIPCWRLAEYFGLVKRAKCATIAGTLSSKLMKIKDVMGDKGTFSTIAHPGHSRTLTETLS